MRNKTFNPSSPAPPLGDTPESVMEYCAWLAREATAGNIDPRCVGEFDKPARTHLNAIAKRHTLRELEDLRSLVDRQEKAIAELKKHEQQDRYSASPTASASLGRVRVSPDGDPH